MKNKFIIGITGGIASGKDLAAEILKKQKVEVIDADKVYHNLIKPKNILWGEIVRNFGEEILDKRKEINRKILKEIIFNSPLKLKKLNKITHPAIIANIKKKIKISKNKIIAVVAPLLIEAKQFKLVDQIWLVSANKKNQIKRLMLRNGVKAKESKKIIEYQAPLSFKKKYAQVIINNNGTKAETRRQVLLYLRRLKARLLNEKK